MESARLSENVNTRNVLACPGQASEGVWSRLYVKVGEMRTETVFTPTALRSKAQGCRGAATLGIANKNSPLPRRGCVVCRRARAQPRWGRRIFDGDVYPG